MQARWNYPTEIRIGAGCVAEIGDACRRHGIERPLVVTDPGFAGLPAMATVLAGIGASVPVFHDVQPNPTGANIDAGIEVFRGRWPRRSDRSRRRLGARRRQVHRPGGRPVATDLGFRGRRRQLDPHRRATGRPRDCGAHHGRNRQRGRPGRPGDQGG